MAFVIESSTDEPVADFPITVTHHIRSASVGPHDLEALCACVDWLREQVLKTGATLASASFSAAPDNPVTPTKVTFTIDWTPPVQAI
jgi:hypothetical protein